MLFIRSQVETALSTYHPDTILIFGGTNDAMALAEGRTSLSMIREDFAKLIESAGDAEVLFVLPVAAKDFPSSQSIQEVREILSVEGQKLGVKLIDPAEVLTESGTNSKDAFFLDGIHPAQESYNRIGKLIRAALSGDGSEPAK